MLLYPAYTFLHATNVSWTKRLLIEWHEASHTAPLEVDGQPHVLPLRVKRCDPKYFVENREVHRYVGKRPETAAGLMEAPAPYPTAARPGRGRDDA